MITEKDFEELLEKKILTAELIGACAFSLNNRVKSYPPGVDEYYNYAYGCISGNTRSAKRKKKELKKREDILLSLVKPICIYKTKRVRFETHKKRWVNKNYDRTCMRVKKAIYRDFEGDRTLYDVRIYYYDYFLYYEIGSFSFHWQVTKDILDKYQGLEIIDVVRLGKDRNGNGNEKPLSLQFIDKVVELIKSEDYNFISEEVS